MATSLKTTGDEVVDTGVKSVLTISPPYSLTATTQDLNVLTVQATPVASTIDTPPGWTKIIEAVAQEIVAESVEGEESLVAIFVRKGAYGSGLENVTVHRTLGEGTVTAAIDVYERILTRTWWIQGHAEDYEYEDEDGITYTGRNVFVTMDDKAVTLTAQFNESIFSPGFVLTVGGIVDYTSLKIVTEDPDTVFDDQVVRSSVNVDLTDQTAWSNADYEFPNFAAVRYRVYLYLDDILMDTLATSDILNVPKDFYIDNGNYPHLNSWLRSVNMPELSIPCFVNEKEETDRNGRVLNTVNVLGKKYPVVATDVFGPRLGTFTFVVGADASYGPDDNADPEDVEFLFDQGDTLMLHHLDGNLVHEPPTFMIVNSVKRTRQGAYNDTVFLYEVDYIEVERPDPESHVTVKYWEDVKNNNLSWELVRNTHSTWLDVLLRP